MKILIVEDQLRLAQFLKQGLTERSYTVACARNCQEARDELCETSYDLIVLDLGLPDGDGLDLLREWRKSGFKEPVLILSARDAVQDRIKGLDLGADDYLPKPFSSRNCWRACARSCAGNRKSRRRCSNTGASRLDLLSHTAHINGEPWISRAANSRCSRSSCRIRPASSPAR